jgi:hypothetical protein
MVTASRLGDRGRRAVGNSETHGAGVRDSLGEAHRGLDHDRRDHVGQDVAEEEAEAAPAQGLRGRYE